MSDTKSKKLELAASDKLTFKEKMSYGIGNFPGGIYAGVIGQINTFYYAWMFLRWEWIVIGQIIYAIWNTINDPLFGFLQDRTKTKQGRYLPWIKYCMVFFALSLLIVFMPPDALKSQAQVDLFSTKQISLFIYYVVCQLFYDTMYTVMYLAWTSLLPQMTMNEGERTKASVLGAISAGIGMAIASLTVISLIDPTAEKIKTFQFTVLILSVISFIPWIFVVKNVRERLEYIPEKGTSLATGVKFVFQNPAGRIYAFNEGILQGIFFFLTTGITFAIAWLLGINLEYQALHPGWGFIPLIPYFIPVVVGAVSGVYIMSKLTPKYGIKTTLMFQFMVEAIGFFLAFLGFLPPMAYTDTPLISNNLWLGFIGLGIALMGLPAYFIYLGPMRADTIDYDEFLTGERRESVYAGVACIFGKPMQSVGMAAVPAILTAYGLVAKPDSSTIKTSLMWTKGYPMALLGVDIATFLIPAILAFIGIFVWHYYPLTKAKLAEIQPVLQQMHEKKKAERLSADGKSKFL